MLFFSLRPVQSGEANRMSFTHGMWAGRAGWIEFQPDDACGHSCSSCPTAVLQYVAALSIYWDTVVSWTGRVVERSRGLSLLFFFLQGLVCFLTSEWVDVFMEQRHQKRTWLPYWCHVLTISLVNMFINALYICNKSLVRVIFRLLTHLSITRMSPTCLPEKGQQNLSSNILILHLPFKTFFWSVCHILMTHTLLKYVS